MSDTGVMGRVTDLLAAAHALADDLIAAELTAGGDAEVLDAPARVEQR